MMRILYPIGAVAILLGGSTVQAGGLRRAQAACGNPDPSVVCTTLFEPVDCGGGCIYSNRCVASAAGFPSCPVVGGSACPVPASSAPSCGFEIKRLSCGSNQCLYDNECFAQKANYNVATDCVPSNAPIVCPPVPDTVSAQCLTTFLDPVICSGCQYQSECFAELAGMINCYSGGTGGTGGTGGNTTTTPPVTGTPPPFAGTLPPVTGTPPPFTGTPPPLTGAPGPFPNFTPCDPSTLGCVFEGTAGPDNATGSPTMGETFATT